MTRYRWAAAIVLFIVLAHTRVTVMPGWSVPAIPLVLVTLSFAAAALLWWLVRQERGWRRPTTWRPN